MVGVKYGLISDCIGRWERGLDGYGWGNEQWLQTSCSFR